MDNRAHQAFSEVVACIVVEVGEVLFHDVIHDIIDAGLHLILGNGHRELRVQDGELRHQAAIEHMANLERVLSIGNHRASIHLRTCAGHRQNATHGQQPLTFSRVLLL